MVNGWGFVFDEDRNFFSYRFSVGSFLDGFIFVSGSFVKVLVVVVDKVGFRLDGISFTRIGW